MHVMKSCNLRGKKNFDCWPDSRALFMVCIRRYDTRSVPTTHPNAISIFIGWYLHLKSQY